MDPTIWGRDKETTIDLGYTEVIFDSMRVEIGLADGQTITIEGRRSDPERSRRKVSGISAPLGDEYERDQIAERLLVAAAWHLLSYELYDSDELAEAIDAAQKEAANE